MVNDIFKKHPVSISAYLPYLLWCILQAYGIIMHNDDISHNIHPPISEGEGMIYGLITTFIAATIYVIIAIFRAGAKKTEENYYLWYCIAIVVPLIALFILISR